MAARLIHQWRNQLEEYQTFSQRYRNCASTWTLGARRSFIRGSIVALNGADGYACRIEDGELLRRYFDVLYNIFINPNDNTLHKYDHLNDVFDPPTPQPKKAKSAMDRNLAALLRSDARTVQVKLLNVQSRKTYTYVTHLPIAVGDQVVVETAGEVKIGTVETVDDEVKIEPGCDTEFYWVIDKIDMAAFEANKKRNDDIVAEAAVIVRENMRKSFAAQVLGAASGEQRDRLLALTGNNLSV
jgi:hypothetical protein